MKKRAQAAGLRVAEWVREVLLNVPEADAQKHEAQTGEVVLAELLALRALFLNLQFRVSQGPLTEAEMRSLIELADGMKLQRARERLESSIRSELRSCAIASRSDDSWVT